jgi:hypothetical protein
MTQRCGVFVFVIATAAAHLTAAPPAFAASRLVVVPVVVAGAAEPDSGLLAALAEGLRQNPQWGVEQGEALAALAGFSASSVPEADLTRLKTTIETAARKLAAGEASDQAGALEAAREELRVAARKGPRGAVADELAWRASTLLVAALAAGKQDTRAKAAAEEAILLFPGRKVTEADKLPATAVQLLGAPRAGLGARLTLRTRPEGCEVRVGDVSLGKDPVEIAVLNGEAYYFSARCTAGAPAAAGATTTSFPKKIVVPSNETTRQDVLDVEFERGLAAEGFRRIRFASNQERRSLEESYVRRVAERFDADSVVLASVGELSGTDWLNARLYTRSGYLNRQGLVRLEAQRANALGRYLATGRDVPGVLKPEEAGALLASSRVSSSQETVVAPWYTDIAGWAMLGVGAIGTSIGLYGNSVGNEKREEADMVRGDTVRQDMLYKDAQSMKFWSGIGVAGGLLFAATGVVLLAVPEYSSDEPYMALRPAWLPGGGAVTLGGRF